MLLYGLPAVFHARCCIFFPHILNKECENKKKPEQPIYKKTNNVPKIIKFLCR